MIYEGTSKDARGAILPLPAHPLYHCAYAVLYAKKSSDPSLPQ